MKKDKFDLVAKNIVNRLGYEDNPITIITDQQFFKLALAIQAINKDSRIISLLTDEKQDIKEILEQISISHAILLAEPETYSTYKLFKYLDFSMGGPRIPNVDSRVLIFPVDSILRLFSVDLECDIGEKNRILSTMQNESEYCITTELGTELTFKARKWIPLDFEVCTAPVETSINGKIVVDGALFFKKIKSQIIFVIENGKLVGITAPTIEGEEDVKAYNSMTEKVMKNPLNLQLAEIGIGFCNGAEINDCFMEAETVVNTCHFCFGNNICYGGNNKSEFHGASVLIKNPQFKLLD